MDWLDLTAKILQSAFFATVAGVAVLTYLQARRTWFQPMRTEVFKQQLRAIDELSSHFIGKSESELRDELDFNALISANTYLLMDSYASLFFDIKFDINKRPYNKKNCPISIVSEEFLELADEPYIKEPTKANKTPDSRTKAAIWSNYKFPEICLTRIHSDNFRNLEKLSRSPLIPKQCQTLVATYLNIAHKNIMLIGDILTEVSKELPEKYPDEDALKQATVSWIHNRYNTKFKQLEPLAGEIEAFIRKYLGTDSLLSGQ